MFLGLRFARSLTPTEMDLLLRIPGVRAFASGSITAPDHAIAIIKKEIAVPFATLDRKVSESPLSRIPLLRPWVPAFLTQYQKEGIAHALTSWRQSNDSGMFVWAAGSGKTIASQAWACAAGEKAKTIVVTKSAIRYQWRDEAERFMEAATTVLEGQKPSALPERGFAIMSYDVLPFWTKEIKAWRPDSAIFDESHKCKSPKRFKATIGANEGEIEFSLRENQTAAAMLVSRAARRRLGTTATPISDRVRDLWAQLDLARPGEFGSYLGPRDANGASLRRGFAWRYCNAEAGQFGGVDDRGMSNMEELRERLKSIVHYVPFSVANRELPPKRRIVTTVKVAEQNRPAAVAEDIRRAARSGKRAAIIEARLWEAASRKRKRLGDLAETAIESKQKIVIFTGRRRDCDEIEKEVASRSKTAVIFKAHGGHSDETRREIQKAYMAAPGPAVLIGTSEAWGEGLNLQDTDLLLIAMLPINPRGVIQIEGRVARLGQSRPVLIQYLVAEGTIDERVASILLRKLPAVEAALDSSDEVRGLAYEFAGADDDALLAELAASLIEGTG